jgi:hypothetical protein
MTAIITFHMNRILFSPRVSVGSALAIAVSTACLLFAAGSDAAAQSRARTELQFPDLPGLVTLKCDFHIHTVFSDGSVWPTVRVEEAWRDGLDAIAMTDHIEYQPHGVDVSTNYGRSFTLAATAARPLGLLVIRAGEITRGEPPGHLNALFLTNIAALRTNDTVLRTNDFREAVKAAIEQGAFVFWNHPGWKQTNHQAVWYAEQGELYDRGWLRGIEIVNGPDYEAGPHQWCLDKKLTMLANSDVHGPIGWDYNLAAGEHRPLTLVLAKSKTEAAIKEALFARQTVVYSAGQLIGDEAFLRPLFLQSLEVKSGPARLKAKTKTLIQLFNRSPVAFRLEPAGKVPEVSLPKTVVLQPGRTSILELTGTTNRLSGSRVLSLPFRVTNLKTGPETSLQVQLPVTVEPAS